MDAFITNYFDNNLGEHYHPIGFSGGEFIPPLQSAKHMLEFLSPLISFHIQGELLSIFLTNTTDTQITASEYEYYMQMILYPQFMRFLKRQENICRKIYESFYPEASSVRNSYTQKKEISYDEALPYLKKFYNLTEDPRTLLKMESYGDEIHIKKEMWIQFILRKSPFCVFRQIGTLSDYYDGIKAYLIRYSSLDSLYGNIVTYLRGQSVTEKI